MRKRKKDLEMQGRGLSVGGEKLFYEGHQKRSMKRAGERHKTFDVEEGKKPTRERVVDSSKKRKR